MDFKDECQKLFDHYVKCYRLGDAAGCASVYAKDAELHPPFGPPSIGRDAIEAAHEEWVTEEEAKDKQLTVTAAGCDGGLGWCMATFSEGATGNGSSLNVLSRQTDGNWLITHCSLNEA